MEKTLPQSEFKRLLAGKAKFLFCSYLNIHSIKEKVMEVKHPVWNSSAVWTKLARLMSRGEEPGVFGMTVCCNVWLVWVCLEPALEKSIENRNGSVLSCTCSRLSFWRTLQAERSTGYRQYSSGQQTSWNPLRTRGVPLHRIETVVGFGRVEVPGDQHHIRTLTSYAGAEWIWIWDLDSGWSCQVMSKWLWRSQAGRTKTGWSHMDSLDQWFSNLEALGPLHSLKNC